MELNAQILLQIVAAETSSSDLSTTARSTTISRAVAFTTGTGISQAQLVWSDSRTIAASGTETLDLAELADDRGTVVLSAVKAIYIRNTGAAVLNLTGGGPPEDWEAGPVKTPSGSLLEIPAGGIYLATNASAAGWAVGSSPQWVIVNNASTTTAATYDIVLIGEGSLT